MFKVLVACYGNWDTTSEIPYLLKKSGCNVDVYCSKKSWLLSNKYYENWIESNSDEETYLNQLIELVKKNNYEWVILGDDLLIKKSNDFIKDEEVFKKIMPINKIENRRMLSSKEGLSDFCKSNNIETPGYTIYNDKNDLQKIKDTLKFPVINKLDFSFGGTGMFVSKSFEEFSDSLEKIPVNENVLIQEFIIGEEIPVEALFYNGELISYLSANVLDYSKDNFSYTTRKMYYENKALKPILTHLGKALGLNGFANMLYMYDTKNNTYHLIEVDPRPNSWMACSRFVAENNFFEGVKKIVSGEYVKGFQGMGIKKPNVEIALFYKDIRRAIWKKDYKGILRWILNSKGYWRFLPLYDFKLTKRITKEIWEEVFVFKWKRITGKI